ncbi:hypothetical protein LTR05_003066 [Lithohypha guttulata]|uniref:Uncharacterized protein n=1 Tax=Lithohypha guttulata TaxID=1690604 RepID=A0AAN7YJL1_9EURO|nr:hypothetical protein LTR05_003066 [Lithohypha guttulata]
MSNESVYTQFKTRLEKFAHQDKRTRLAPQDLTVELLEAIAPRSSELTKHLGWYQHWLDKQLLPIRSSLRDCLQGFDAANEDNWQLCVAQLWKGVAERSRADKLATVDSIVEDLVKHKILKRDVKTSLGRQIVFALLGWQTMLWKSDIGNCPPSQICIEDEMDGFAGQSSLVFRQEQCHCAKPLSELLMSFGVILPSPRFWTHDEDKEQASLGSLSTVSSSTLNAHLLMSMAKQFKIEWTDILTHHLEYDSLKGKLFLYRFPSFCLSNIDETTDSVIYTCAQSTLKPISPFWATTTDITTLLQETLQSYRLLFGQTKAARKYYRTLRPFPRPSNLTADELLHELCGRKRCELTVACEKESYDLDEDFPMYKNRLVVLANALAKEKPRTWKQLWHDKRDSAQWLTFWLVLVIGGIGLILQFTQVVLALISTIFDLH